MKRKTKTKLCAALLLLAAFVLWTALVRCVDVRAIGPLGTRVGFASLNAAFHSLTGVHRILYEITDWLGLVPIAAALGFALLGLGEWIRRRSLLKVDRSILVLGAFYILVIAIYIFFELVVINYRPVLIEGYLEASYPSSTTLLTATVMPTAAHQLSCRIKNSVMRRSLCALIYLFTAFMIIARLISGVHWLSDIVGGVLLSAGLVTLYTFLTGKYANVK
jgi:undecaprenyl-diphosphatase